MVVAAALLIPSVASAHAVVFPKTSRPGAYEKYVLRVPNEKGVPTTRVEIRFPSGVRVVSFSEVAGWQLEILRDSAKAITGAVWTGTLPSERFIEFPFVAVNPKENATLVWPAYQTYEGGERVDWVGPEDSPKPASATTIGDAASGGGKGTMYAAWAALLLSLLSLGLSLRKTA
jgi:uncharacterized protein YcnI